MSPVPLGAAPPRPRTRGPADPRTRRRAWCGCALFAGREPVETRQRLVAVEEDWVMLTGTTAVGGAGHRLR